MDVLWINVKYIARIIKRFTLQVSRQIPEAIPLLRLVVPVTDIDTLLRSPSIQEATKDISGASGPVVYFTVPAGKRWHLYMVRRQATTGNSYVSVSDGTTAFLLTETGTTAGRAVIESPVPMDEGWTIRMQNTNNGADTSILLSIVIEEEESFS